MHAEYFLEYEARNHVHEKNICLWGRSALLSLLPVGLRGMGPVISVSVHWSVVVLWEPSLGLWSWIAMFLGPENFVSGNILVLKVTIFSLQSVFADFQTLKIWVHPNLPCFQGVFSAFYNQSRVTEDFANPLTSWSFHNCSPETSHENVFSCHSCVTL